MAKNRKTSGRRLGAALLAGCLMIAPAALADQPPAPTRAPAVQAVVDCRKIGDDARRLACYDAAVAKMDEAQTHGDLVTLDREQRRTVRREAFGLTLPSLAMFDRGEKPEEMNRVTDTVVDVSKTADDKWVVRLQSGAVWRQIDDNELFKKPHARSTVVVSKAALGSFMMKIDGQPSIRVHRDS